MTSLKPVQTLENQARAMYEHGQPKLEYDIQPVPVQTQVKNEITPEQCFKQQSFTPRFKLEFRKVRS